MSYYKDMGNKYAQVPEVILDFHGYTKAECQDAIDELIRRGPDRRVSKDGTRRNSAELHVRIIVGKGKNSPNGPILPDFVKNYLTSHHIRWNQSKIQDGGEGSLEVYFS